MLSKNEIPIQAQIDTAILKHQLESRLSIKTSMSSVKMRNYLNWMNFQLDKDNSLKSEQLGQYALFLLQALRSSETEEAKRQVEKLVLKISK